MHMKVVEHLRIFTTRDHTMSGGWCLLCHTKAVGCLRTFLAGDRSCRLCWHALQRTVCSGALVVPRSLDLCRYVGCASVGVQHLV